MHKKFSRIPALAMALLPAFCLLQNPLHADSLSELYLGSSNTNTGSAIGPNILIILDTSGSMTKHDLTFEVNPVTFWNEPYNPGKTYPGPCDKNLAYRKTFDVDRNGDGIVDEQDVDEDDFQSCPNSNSFPIAAMACERVLQQGFALDHFAEFRAKGTVSSFNGRSMDGKWYNLVSDFNGVETVGGATIWRECASDSGTHGATATATDLYPSNTGTAHGWTNNPANAYDITARNVQLVGAGNYINYYRWSQTRLAAVQAALREVIAALPGETRLGVMRFDVKTGSEGSSDGGYMIKEFVELGPNTQDSDGNTVLSANRQAVLDAIFAIDPADNGGTPLAETLFEALQVFRGGEITFGSDAQKWNIDTAKWPWDNNTTTFANVSSVAASRDPGDSNKYKSPIVYECQKSAVIFLSDGEPDGDRNTYQHFRHLPNAATYAPSRCDDSSSTPPSCLREVAAYMANEDLRTDLDGDQTVTTYTVGFGADLGLEWQEFLRQAAEQGGGSFTQADSYEDLKDAFNVIFRQEIAKNVSLSSPAVTVNAFNRMSHKNDLYFTMFDPILDSAHWPGNLKKYKLSRETENNTTGELRIRDALGKPALANNSSQLAYDALSFWTDPSDPLVAANDPIGKDGDKTPLGGAASKLPDPANRNLYTWSGNTSTTLLSHTANLFESSNSNITNAMLGLSFASTQRNNVINFMRGYGPNNEARRAMGAAPHGVPTVITYGDNEATAKSVIFMPTNDGFLHAIDAESGVELWAFLPTESMHNFAHFYSPPSNPPIAYGLDGSVVSYTEGTGVADKKWIFFGMRRGGNSIYAIDVTNRTAPEIKWRIQGGVSIGFEDLAQTWSEPRIGILDLGGTAEPVLVFGGGYDDASQDSAAATAGYVDDSKGNGVYIVKADTGALLWRAGPDSGADLPLTDMKSSIAASVKLKDKNEDGYFDLVYAADLGGRIFRFDIDNANNTSNSLSVTGGMIASLGAQGSVGELANNRKFFAEPDIVLVGKDGQSYWAINIASGDRERPKSNMTTENYLFSIKDENIFGAPSNYAYGITTSSLYDATANLIQNPTTGTTAAAEYNALLASDGWMVELERSGEKGLSAAKTFDFRVFFTTFDPTPLNTTSCNSEPGTARLYVMDLVTATAVEDLNNDGNLTREDRDSVLTHGTIPPALTFMFIEDANGHVEATNIIGRSDDEAPMGNTSVVRRTFWNIQGNDDKEQ